MNSQAVNRKIWVDGELKAWDQATVHLLSHSLQRGSLIFDYMSIHGTARGPAIFRLKAHLERLVRSAELIGLTLPMDIKALRAAVVETVRANSDAHNVKVCAFLPSLEVGMVPVNAQVSVAIAAYDPAQDLERSGGERPDTLSLHVEQDKRKTQARFISPQAKVSANYLSPMLAAWNARRQGYDDILLLDDDGNLAEAPTSNVFLVDDGGCLHTPLTDSVLEGVTRRSLLELAARDGIPVKEERIPAEQIFEAREVFLSATSKGVWPVHGIDGKPVGGVGAPCPGPVTAPLQQHFKRIERGEDPAFWHWLTFIEEDE